VAGSLCTKVRHAETVAAKGDRAGASSDLINYQNEVAAHSGKALSADQANTLIGLARAYATTL
jgi:hypothetical protein